MQSQPSLASSISMPRSPREPGRRPTLTIVWRRAEPDDNRLTWRDRIELLEWTDRSRALGVSRVCLEHPDPEDANHEVGDFVLIYDGVGEWARWAVAREAGRYLLWSPSTGRSLGTHPTLGAALAAIHTPDC